MPRKVVRVYIPKGLSDVLERLSDRLGLSESEVLRLALIDYASKYSLVTEQVHRAVT